MQKYLILVGNSLGEQPYVLSIFPSEGNNGSQVRHKFYSEQDLRQDLKDCLDATDDGLDEVIKIVSRSPWYQISPLSNECAARLGWH
jgi:hypothetical protein